MSAPRESVAAHLLVSGRVQGVFYRASARSAAGKLGLRGWVRNLDDGRVEAWAEGPRADVESFIAWCRKGPPAARVGSVEVEWGAAQGHAGFDVRD